MDERMIETEMAELNSVDQDIKRAYLPFLGGRFAPGAAIKIQMARSLKRLNENLEQLIEVLISTSASNPLNKINVEGGEPEKIVPLENETDSEIVGNLEKVLEKAISPFIEKLEKKIEEW